MKAAKKTSAGTAADLMPVDRSLESLRSTAIGCTACDLYKRGTQTVFGEGRPGAAVMLVGEQPGDMEDREGKPFVGPAGRLLDRSLEKAGIDRSLVYVTNVVKHFKWEQRGKRRLHSKPNTAEIRACVPWLYGEIEAVEPKAIVCLGATAAQALFGKEFRVSKDRGKIFSSELAEVSMATVHPSSLLRAPDEETRRAETARFVADLSKIAHLVG
jgi:uracil-DNA glycosylase